MTRRTLIASLLVATSFLGILLPGCSHSHPVWPNKPGMKILATFPPIYCFAQIVAGDDANVMCLLTGSDPHNTELTQQQILKVRGADLVLANGLGLEDQYLSRLTGSSGKKVNVFNIGDVLEKKHHDLLEDADHDHAHDHGSGKDEHEAHDPHFWLGPDRAKVMVDIIADKLIEIDPAKKDNFRKRADDFKKELDKLKAYGLDKFKNIKNRNLVTQHDSLGYFAAEFNLKIVGHIRSQKGQDEGGGKKFILKWKEEGKRPAAFTYEPGEKKAEVDSMRATLKKEGVETAVVEVDPIETVVLEGDNRNPDPGYYLKKMYENIDNLAKALQ